MFHAKPRLKKRTNQKETKTTDRLRLNWDQTKPKINT